MPRLYFMILIGLLAGFAWNNTAIAADPFELNRRLGKGVNIGATFDANPPEVGWGIRWEDHFAEEISKAGFDSIRLPVRWNVRALAEPPYTVDDAFFKRVDQVVKGALRHGLLVVLDFHQYDDLPKDVAGQKDRFVAIWRQVAEHYRDYPQDKVLFELLNEPQPSITPEVWNDLFREFLAAIRDSNPTRIVVLEPADWGSLRALDQLKMPDDKHIILSFHHYDPIQFTHQGSHLPGSHNWLGTTWTGTPAQKKFVHDQFTKAKDFAEKHHVPVWLGEFGSFQKADMKSRVMWAEFVARTAESYGFSWAYWDFCSPWFGLYDRRTKTWNAELLDALMGTR